MSNADPAIEAAQRAWDARYMGGSFGRSVTDDGVGALAIAAAREALIPIRELDIRLSREDNHSGRFLAGMEYVLSMLGPLVYTEAELGE